MPPPLSYFSTLRSIQHVRDAREARFNQIRQLFPHLREFVRKYKDNFDGTRVADSPELDGQVTEIEEDDGASWLLT